MTRESCQQKFTLEIGDGSISAGLLASNHLNIVVVRRERTEQTALHVGGARRRRGSHLHEVVGASDDLCGVRDGLKRHIGRRQTLGLQDTRLGKTEDGSELRISGSLTRQTTNHASRDEAGEDDAKKRKESKLKSVHGTREGENS